MTLAKFSSLIRMINMSAETPALATSTSTGPWCSSTTVNARVDRRAVRHVTLDGKQLLVGRRARAAVRDGDLVPVGGQPARDRQPDAPVSAGNQHRTGDEGRTATGVLAGRIG